MADKGRAAIYKGLGIPLEIKEYPVPDPEPGAVLVKVSVANICGSEMHLWRGDLNLGLMGAPLPVILGHEATGRVAKLGAGISTDSAGQPLNVGDRVTWMYFYPCGRCPACLKGHHAACPMNAFFMGPSELAPHFTGPYADYYYVRPNHTIFKIPDDLTDMMAAPANCALSERHFQEHLVKIIHQALQVRLHHRPQAFENLHIEISEPEVVADILEGSQL